MRPWLSLTRPLAASNIEQLLHRTRGLASSFHGRFFSSEAAPEREQMHYDVCIVGAGPAGLSAAIKLKQICKDKGKELSVCVIEKGSEVGAHILSGNVLEPRALDELLPGWKDMEGLPLMTPTTKDRFYYLTQGRSIRMPTPPQMHNKGNYVISLSQLVRWLATKAEELGVEIYPGFAGRQVLYSWDGAVLGVGTNDFGVAKDGSHKGGYQPGVDLLARATLLAEGARGSLSQQIMERYNLREKAGACPQTYALGIKEVWEVPEAQSKPGEVLHTIGYPLDNSTYGGGFLYHMGENKVALGLVVGLDYQNPYLSPYQEFQRWKSHPLIAGVLQGGTCVQYGARTLNEGGMQSVPSLAFPGGALIGCSAGFLNVPKIKGTHTAMKSGMIAAEAAYYKLTEEKLMTGSALSEAEFDARKEAEARGELADRVPPGSLDMSSYERAIKMSWVWTELERVRNVRPGFRWGLWGGLANAVLETLTRGKTPWTLQTQHADHEATQYAAQHKPIEYPKPDGLLTFDLPTSLYRSGTNHDHDQPSHLQLGDERLPEVVNKAQYDGPEGRYCPAGVYEYQQSEGGRWRLQVNAQNCLHCKACDIKDPKQNIKWTVPEGGGGPNYTVM